jgi:hypothetical protein
MKRCPTCDRTFEETLTYCLIDGSILSAPFAPQATLVIPEPTRTEPSNIKDLPAQPARKSKRFQLIMGVVAAVLVVGIAAVIYFGKRERNRETYRIADVRLFREGKSTTRFFTDDVITVTVSVRPVAKDGSLWVTKRLSYLGENQFIDVPDIDPSPPPLSQSSTSFPLSGASKPGTYLLEVKLQDEVENVDSHAVGFEVIEHSK